MGKIVNPFGNDSTPNLNVQKEPIGKKESLPPRGTGLKTGNAEERREGNPRTDEERTIRHLKETAYQEKPLNPPSLKEQWRQYYAEKRNK